MCLYLPVLLFLESRAGCGVCQIWNRRKWPIVNLERSCLQIVFLNRPNRREILHSVA